MTLTKREMKFITTWQNFSMMIGYHYKPLLDYFYSAKIVGEDWVEYKDWSDKFPETNCMCQLCFNAYDRLGKIKWKCSS